MDLLKRIPPRSAIAALGIVATTLLFAQETSDSQRTAQEEKAEPKVETAAAASQASKDESQPDSDSESSENPKPPTLKRLDLKNKLLPGADVDLPQDI